MDTNAMYCAEQINIPLDLGSVLKQYTKSVILEEPEHLYKWSANYFAQLANLPVIFGPEGEYLDGVKAGVKAPEAAPAGEPGPEVDQSELVNEIFSAYNTEDGRITQETVDQIFAELQEKLGFAMTPEDIAQYMSMLEKDEEGLFNITDVYSLFFQPEGEEGEEGAMSGEEAGTP